MRVSIIWRTVIPIILLIIFINFFIYVFFKPELITYLVSKETSNYVLLSQAISENAGMDFHSKCDIHKVKDFSANQSLKYDVQVTALIPNCGNDNLIEIDPDNFSNQPEIQKALHGEIFSDYQILKNQIRIQIVSPVFYDENIIGVIHIEKSGENIYQTLNQLINQFILILTIIAIGVISYLFFTMNKLALSLKRINQDLQKLSSKPGESWLSDRPDEIGTLYRSLSTTIKKLQGKLEQVSSLQESLANVIENMNDGIVIVNESGDVTLTNRAAKKMFLVEKTRRKNLTLMEIFRNHQLDEIWLKCRDSKKTLFVSIENPGTHLFIECVATPLQSKTELSILLLLQDVTQIRQLENVRRTFVSNVSHELRTPLASLKAIVDTLQEGAAKDIRARQKFLQLMNSEIDHLTHMVEELVELSRIESGQFPLKKQPVKPNTLIETSIDRMKLQAERAGLTLTHSVEPGLPSLSVDVSRIEQVLMNLIHNAIKFTKPGGKIHINAGLGKNEVIFSIKDTGMGIPPNELERVFERFYKVDRSRSEQGTGLGLSIARHIINAHSGKIWVESILTQGSTFFFTIPV